MLELIDNELGNQFRFSTQFLVLEKTGTYYKIKVGKRIATPFEYNSLSAL